MKGTKYPGIHKLSDGQYRVRFKARNPKTGKYQEQKKVIAAETAEEAEEKRMQLKRRVENGVLGNSVPRQTLKSYAKSWLLGRLPTLKASTRNKYAMILDLHIVPELGEYYLDALTPADVTMWRDKQEGMPSTINTRLRVFRTLINDAVADLDLARNPAARVRALREKRAEDEPNSLTPEELGKVLAYLREHEPTWYALFVTLALTGTRFGEVSALKWDDIDHERKIVHIRRSQWRGIVDTTKTGSARTIPLTEELDTVLKEHRQRLLKDQAPGLEDGWVFPSKVGTLLFARSLRKPLHNALEATKLDCRFTVHGFRRTFNNLVRQVASGEVVRSMTGHVTERMTEHYSHIGTEEKRKAVTSALRLVTDQYGPNGGTKSGTIGGTLEPKLETVD